MFDDEICVDHSNTPLNALPKSAPWLDGVPHREVVISHILRLDAAAHGCLRCDFRVRALECIRKEKYVSNARA